MSPHENLILALDTSTALLSVSLDGVGGPRTRTHESTGAHQEHLFPFIEELLAERHAGCPDLSALAVIVGPGSFTGLRIGLAAAKALAWSLAIPIFPFNRLDLMEAGASPTTPSGSVGWTLCLLDARRHAYYGALFHGGRRRGEYLDLSTAELSRLVANPTAFFGEPVAPLCIVGDFPAQLKPSAAPEVTYAGPVSWPLTPALCAGSRSLLVAGDKGADPRSLAPFYLRPPEPVVKLAAAGR